MLSQRQAEGAEEVCEGTRVGSLTGHVAERRVEERGRVDTLWVSREEERDRLIGAIEVAAT